MITILAGKLTPVASVEVAPVNNDQRFGTDLGNRKQLTNSEDRTLDKTVFHCSSVLLLESGVMKSNPNFHESSELLIDNMSSSARNLPPRKNTLFLD